MPGRLGQYDDRAKRVLALAQDEAWRVFHHDAIGPEHLLLAVIRAGTGDRPGSGSVGDALNSLGLTLSKARNALEALSGRGDPQRQIDERPMPFTPEGHTVIDLAPAEAKFLNAEKVTDTHVLLAVLREPGKAEGMLQSLGLSTEAVRQKVIGSQ
jgi:ATP-dependent Clp protease ATP-binding subunit ClpA